MAIKTMAPAAPKKTAKKTIKPRIPMGGQQQSPQMGMSQQPPQAPGDQSQGQLPGYSKGKAGRMSIKKKK